MDGKSSLTLNNQESYAVEPDCRSRICAFDDGDSAQKIARALDEGTFLDQESKNAFYVGCSRATTYLDLISVSPADRIAEALTGRATVGPRSIAAISTELCVKIGTQSDLSSG